MAWIGARSAHEPEPSGASSLLGGIGYALDEPGLKRPADFRQHRRRLYSNFVETVDRVVHCPSESEPPH